MTGPDLLGIRNCLEGWIPAVLATRDAAGVPNVSLISQVHYVDPARVALSYQFFNKTRRNILETRIASVEVIDPLTAAQFRLDLGYESTETSGPLFESMKAKLAAIASHSGMAGVFVLRGADIFRVTAIEAVPCPMLAVPAPSGNLLAAVRQVIGEMAAATDLGDLLDRTLAGLGRCFGIAHAMVLMVDAAAGRLYTVASRGYAVSGIGSELALGAGIVGVAARAQVPIRVGRMTSEQDYSAAIRDRARDLGLDWAAVTEIPFPGLAAPESQIALPVIAGGRTIAVLVAESDAPMRFRYDDEDALAIIADRLGSLMPAMHEAEAPPVAPPPQVVGTLAVRHYAADDSVFVGHDYLIKGVAGAIFWKLVSEHAASGRTEFTNRELRLDLALRLPEHAENLEARILLLQRRLREHDCPIRVERSGRGKLALVVPGRLALEQVVPDGGRPRA